MSRLTEPSRIPDAMRFLPSVEMTTGSCHSVFPSDGAGDWVKKVWERVPPPKIGGGKVGVDRIAGGVTLPRPCSSVPPRPVIASATPARPVIGKRKWGRDSSPEDRGRLGGG